MAIKLIYKDEIPGVAEGATVNISVEAENFSVPALLPFGANTGGIATLEPNGWGLTRDYKVKGNQSFGFWSSEISDENGNFINPPVFVVKLDAQYIVSGITLGFSAETGDYCKEVTVILYQGDNIIFADSFTLNEALFDIELDNSTAFDRLAVSINKTNLPYRRAKLELLKIGITRTISGNELISTNMICETNLVSDTLSVNVLDAEFQAKRETNIVFQKKQAIEVYNDDELLGVFYIDSGNRKGETRYSFSANDAIGLFELYEYHPSYRNGDGIWFEDTPVVNILDNILGGILPYELSDDLKTKTLRGYCKGGTIRDALSQVAFSIGAAVDTSGGIIKIFKPQQGRGILPEETFIDGSIEVAEIITGVTVMAYDIYNKHPADSNDTPFVQTPLGAYKYYTYSATSTNPDIPTYTTLNNLMYKEIYLISSQAQAQEIADGILAYYMRRNKYTFSHVDKGQQVGDHVTGVLPWGESTSGTILKKSIKHSGITVSETTLLLDD